MGESRLMTQSVSFNRWIWIAVAVLIFFILISQIWNSGRGDDGLSLGPKVGVVTLEGPIFDSKPVIEDFDEIAERNDVKAIVFRINSPGGAVAPSQEIYEKVKKVNNVVPIITSIGTVAASGGYYSALGSTLIMANPGSVTGSIGVIMDYPVATDLLEKIGLRFETVKSGSLKDAGSPTREVTEQDRDYFKDVVHDMHTQFVEAVAEGRNLDQNTVKELANGRVFTGRQSYQLGLIDSLGTFEDAVALAAEIGNIDGKPKLARPHKEKPQFMEWLLQEAATTLGYFLNKEPAYRWHWRVS